MRWNVTRPIRKSDPSRFIERVDNLLCGGSVPIESVLGPHIGWHARKHLRHAIRRSPIGQLHGFAGNDVHDRFPLHYQFHARFFIDNHGGHVGTLIHSGLRFGGALFSFQIRFFDGFIIIITFFACQFGLLAQGLDGIVHGIFHGIKKRWRPRLLFHLLCSFGHALLAHEQCCCCCRHAGSVWRDTDTVAAPAADR